METLNPTVAAVAWKDHRCILLDQTLLPGKETYLECSDYRDVVRAIKALAVRGAPAIGVAGAYAITLAGKRALELSESERKDFFERAVTEIRQARPTAVNLEWAVRRLLSLLGSSSLSSEKVQALEAEAQRLHEEDIHFNREMAKFGASLFKQSERILTHCNTGDLATGGIGTAFGVIHQAFRDGKVEKVYACEARPVLQGARLTAWELSQNNIPFHLICDGMAAAIMRNESITGVILGADRITANGDVANKIGTYGLAVLAKHHGVPFYVAAPSSTFDLALQSGDDIPIEERASEEILGVLGERRPSQDFPVLNPAFDVTPASLITAIVCERGVLRPPYAESIAQLLA